MNTWFSPSPANITVAATTINDTSSVTINTFQSSVKVSSSKMSSSSVTYNGSQIAASGSTSWTLQFQPQLGTHTYTINYLDSSNNVIATKSVTVERHILGDINGDGKVDLEDLSLLGNSYGIGVPDGDWRDLNGDGQVNILDLSLFATQFGQSTTSY
jgi:uncharacterized protein (DUF2141 family)